MNGARLALGPSLGSAYVQVQQICMPTESIMSNPTVILSYARTPMGAMQGALAGVSATDLCAAAV